MNIEVGDIVQTIFYEKNMDIVPLKVLIVEVVDEGRIYRAVRTDDMRKGEFNLNLYSITDFEKVVDHIKFVSLISTAIESRRVVNGENSR